MGQDRVCGGTKQHGFRDDCQIKTRLPVSEERHAQAL